MILYICILHTAFTAYIVYISLPSVSLTRLDIIGTVACHIIFCTKKLFVSERHGCPAVSVIRGKLHFHADEVMQPMCFPDTSFECSGRKYRGLALETRMWMRMNAECMDFCL